MDSKNIVKKLKEPKVRKGIFFAILAVAVVVAVVVVVNAEIKKDFV